MTKYRYLIVGGGMTAAAAVEEIREADKESSIGLISAEPNPPYDRPPLSKDLWKGDDLDSIWRETPEQQVDLHLGRKATHLDIHNKRVTDDHNNEYTYEKLLLATGGKPKRLPFGDNRIIYYRTVEDYKKLRQLSKQNLRFAVIGGGFIGSEVAAGLEVGDGIVVDQSMHTSAQDVYAAGDVANFYAPSLDQRIRVEHEDCAEDTGEVAGRNMTGDELEYDELPYFYSDLFELGYEAVGLTDPRLETYADWQEPNQKGVIYSLDQGRVRGVVLWNVWGKKDEARKLIAEPGPVSPKNLKGRISS